MHVVAAGTCVLAIAGFAKLAYDVSHGDNRFDHQVMQAMRHEGKPIGPLWMADLIRDITSLGSAAVLVGLTLSIVGYLLLTDRHRVAALIAVAVAGGAILNMLLKNAFERARPDETLHLVAVHSTSFPSGHAMGASIFYLTMGSLLARMAKRRREKVYLISVAVVFTCLVAFSRVYLGVHYPTDVLAGWAAGTTWALVCWFFADWLGRRGSLRQETGEEASA